MSIDSQKPIKNSDDIIQKRTFFSYFANPWVGLIGTIASVIGIPLSIIFYLKAQVYPDLQYSISPVRAEVVKANQVSKLITLYEGKEINKDITIAQIALWNSGKAAITSDTVLEPIYIKSSKSEAILEAKVLQITRPVTSIRLDDSQRDKGVIGVNWRILEQHDGCVIQITYIGKPATSFNVLGIIQGQNQILINKRGAYKNFISSIISLVPILYGLILFIMWNFTKARDRFKKFSIIIAILLLFILYIYINVISGKDSFPPINFLH